MQLTLNPFLTLAAFAAGVTLQGQHHGGAPATADGMARRHHAAGVLLGGIAVEVCPAQESPHGQCSQALLDQLFSVRLVHFFLFLTC